MCLCFVCFSNKNAIISYNVYTHSEHCQRNQKLCTLNFTTSENSIAIIIKNNKIKKKKQQI